MDTLIINLVDQLYEFNNKDVLIIFKIGIFNKDSFSTKILSKDMFLKIVNLLESCKSWEDSYVEEQDCYIESEIIYCTKILHFSNLPFDNEIIISNRKEKQGGENNNLLKITSTNYVKKNHKFVLKEHTFNNRGPEYSFHIEILKFEGDVKYNIHSTLLKILDINNIFEKIDNIKTVKIL